jgi:hypothetical protein
VLPIILNARIKVRVFVCTNQLIPLAEFRCYVDAVIYTARLSPDPPMPIARRRRRSI